MHDNMNKRWILITLCAILSGCTSLGKQSPASDAQSPGSETEQLEQSISQHWIGRYSLYISTDTIMEDASNIGVSDNL